MFKFLKSMFGTKKKSEFEEDLEADLLFKPGQINRYSRPHICSSREAYTRKEPDVVTDIVETAVVLSLVSDIFDSPSSDSSSFDSGSSDMSDWSGGGGDFSGGGASGDF